MRFWERQKMLKERIKDLKKVEILTSKFLNNFLLKKTFACIDRTDNINVSFGYCSS